MTRHGQTLGAIGLDATGAATSRGVLAQTLGAITLAASGLSQPVVLGSLAGTLGPVTLSANGSAPARGDVAATLGELSLAASGVVRASAVLAKALGPITLLAFGTAVVPYVPPIFCRNEMPYASTSIFDRDWPVRV